MSKQALKRVRKAIGLPVCREPLPAFAWPGGYPIFYVFNDGGVCCPNCANANITEIDAEGRNSHGGWALGGSDVNWEDEDMHCDHCHKPIPCAYPKS
jgi:hypothetical protein